MYKYLLFSLLLFCSSPIFSQQKDQIVGKWLNATGEAHIQIYATSGKYFGKIYDPKTGKTYSCKITLQGSDKLNVRGFVGFSMLGRNEIWTRIK